MTPRLPFPMNPMVGRNITPPSGGLVAQTDFAIDSYDSEYYLASPYHDSILKEGIALGRRFVFSPYGRRVAAWVLDVPWETVLAGKPVPPVEELGYPGTYAIDAIDTFERSQKMSVIIDSRMTNHGEVHPEEPEQIRMNFDHVKAAAVAQYRGLDEQASDEAKMMRLRHVYYLGTVIAHEAQHVIRRVAPTMSEVTPPSLRDGNHAPPSPRLVHHGDGKKDVVEVGEGGWYFEDMVLGGRLIRITAPLRRSDPNTFPSCISRLALMLEKDGVMGYALIKDEVIQQIVEAKEGWEALLPINTDDCCEPWQSGSHPAALGRAGDGSLQGRKAAKAAQYGSATCGTHAGDLLRIPQPNPGTLTFGTKTYHTYIPSPLPTAPSFDLHLTRFRDTLLIWIGTAQASDGSSSLEESAAGDGERLLGADWSVAMPSNRNIPVTSTPVLRTSSSDLSLAMSQRLAKRFPGNQVHLSLSLSSKLLPSQGSAHDPFASKVLLIMEKKLSAWLGEVLASEGQA